MVTILEQKSKNTFSLSWLFRQIGERSFYFNDFGDIFPNDSGDRYVVVSQPNRKGGLGLNLSSRDLWVSPGRIFFGYIMYLHHSVHSSLVGPRDSPGDRVHNLRRKPCKRVSLTVHIICVERFL